MGAGRPKKPTELKALQGTSRKDRETKSLEVIKFDDITQLRAINVKGLESVTAKRIFNDRANMLIANKMLSPQDLDQLIIYSNAMSLVIECSKHTKKGLYTEIKDEDGNFKSWAPNPYLKLFKDMSEVVTKIGAEFGFSPLSRMKFKLEPEIKKDPFQELLDSYNNQ